jgi:outer membrane lipoprotein-sorting protein
MKKSLWILICLLLSVILINAQSLEDIVRNYTTANKLDQITTKKTIKITGKMSMMGMEMPMEIWRKNPNKIKTVTNVEGQQIVQAFNGEKGYSINPMTGSYEPVEMRPEEVKQMLRGNTFENSLAKYLRNGQLELAGEEEVNGNPAYWIKATVDQGTVSNFYIDKSTYHLAKSTIDVSQRGMPVTVESFPSEYTETDGVILPMKVKTSVSGMEMEITFTKIEVDIPMEDSMFNLK